MGQRCPCGVVEPAPPQGPPAGAAPPAPPAYAGRTYSAWLGTAGRAGSVACRVHAVVTGLPFWEDAAGSPGAASEVEAARRITGELPTVDLCFEDRVIADRIIDNWKRRVSRGSRRGSTASAGGAGPRTVLINSYSGTKCLTLKAQMALELRGSPCGMPETYVLYRDGVRGCERAEFAAAHARAAPGTAWALKPSHRNKGIGIRIVADVASALDYVDGDEADRAAYVAQRYVERPFLLAGRRKFDLRCWVLVTAAYDVYLYRAGVLRTASEPYNPDDLTDELSHLTNHCIQEHGHNFGKFEEGNEMWYPGFQKYLDSLPPGTPGHGCSLEENILPQVKSIIVASLRKACDSVTLSINDSGSGARLGCFQLFGFDFMADEDMRVWLIEINGSPASAEALLDGMAAAIVRTAIVPLFPAPAGTSYAGIGGAPIGAGGEGTVSTHGVGEFELLWSRPGQQETWRRRGSAAGGAAEGGSRRT